TGRLDGWLLKPNQISPHGKNKVRRMFWDSDTGKWLEAVGYSLQQFPDSVIEVQADDVIQRMEQAQQADGYLNTYFTVMEQEYRWRNLRDWHEMYNAGHLIEGAVAYYEATGKRQVLDILIRYADLIGSLFGPNEGQKRGYPGHPELELALVKLYRATGEQRFLDLSKYFIDERGQSPIYFDIEAEERGEDRELFWARTYRYCQAHAPLREQNAAVGHSVRACYLYAGIADVAIETGDQSLVDLSKLLWDDLTRHQMYIHGGLGPAQSHEGFTFAYDLPNEMAYAETCAAIALVFWAHRMFHLDPHGRYIDVMERTLYNGVMSGVSFEGTEFFYANPLAAFPNVNPYDPRSGLVDMDHYRRQEWFDCPCCPPNLARLLASLPSYFYSLAGDTVYTHLYNSSRAIFDLNGVSVQLEQQTNYPWDGDIQLTVQLDQSQEFDLALRIPAWCHEFDVKINGAAGSVKPVNGYIHLRRQWTAGDAVQLSLAMPVERVAPHPQIRQDAGTIALQRGPVLYCLEEVDNGPQLANIVIPRDSQLTSQENDHIFSGIPVITGDALRLEPDNWPDQELYHTQSQLSYSHTPLTFTAIPYSLWANREPGEMRVWIREG
ncbi:MAG: glycoside hydrolase family 127 protein, partial [Anaerolineae bacterium]|nr:glycoside hydrolase family 127 protein [Anaerolineae bacterium]